MNTTQHLNSLGISMTQARAFVLSNLGNPAAIYNAAKQHKIDSQMLAEIVDPIYPKITAEQIEDFFTGKGLNGKGLNTAVLNPAAPVKSWQGGSPIADLMTFNDNSGNLSNESLRNAVVAKVGEDKYLSAFNPRIVPGSADGMLSTADLGFSQLGDIEATWQNMESLYYGSMIKTLRAISVSEYLEWQAFQLKNSAKLSIQDPATVSAMNSLMLSFMLDPATTNDPSILNDTDLSMAVQEGLVHMIHLIGINPDQSLFGNIGV